MAARQKTAAPKPAKAAPKRAAARGGDKRDRILDAAVRVFAKEGFHATKVSDIARAAGVADGTIYLYFASKEELLVSLFEDRVERLLRYMERELEKLDTPPARYRRIVELQLGIFQDERELAEVVTIILRESTKLIKEFAAPKFMTYLDAIAKVVAEGQARGDFRADVSPHLVARATFGALDGIALTWAVSRGEPEALTRAAAQLADFLLRGLGRERT
ncbi:MAG: TetR family transcriptional regulator [Polyangiaceae bacterium]